MVPAQVTARSGPAGTPDPDRNCPPALVPRGERSTPWSGAGAADTYPAGLTTPSTASTALKCALT